MPKMDDERDDKLAYAIAMGETSHRAMCEFAGYFLAHQWDYSLLVREKQKDHVFRARVVEWRELIDSDRQAMAQIREQREELTRGWVLSSLQRVARMALGDEPVMVAIPIPRPKGSTEPIKVEQVKMRKTDVRAACTALSLLAEISGLLGDEDLPEDDVQAALAELDRARAAGATH